MVVLTSPKPYVHTIIIIIIIIIITLDWQPGSKVLFCQKLSNSSQHKQALYRFLLDVFTFDHRQPQTDLRPLATN